MTIHKDSYKYLEVGQVRAIDDNFADKKGTLYISNIYGDRICSYNSAQGEKPLTQEEWIKLSRIVYGWGSKTHAAAKDQPAEMAESKPGSFSKIKNCQGKTFMHLVPLNVIRAVADVYTAEFPQYGEDWKHVPNAKIVFYDSLFRHLEAFQSGEKYDTDGKLHIIKVICNAIFIAWHVLKEGD